MKTVVAAAAMFVGSLLFVEAQGPVSVVGGVYTAEQAKRGEKLYADGCADCHAPDLTGEEPIPGLQGPEFIKKWSTLGDLFDKVHTQMPSTAPGSLTQQETADLLAYVLSVNKYPAGKTELAAKIEPLKQIKLEPR